MFLDIESRNCSNCPLADSPNFVTFEEVPEARILIIGDAPKVGYLRKPFWETREGEMLRSILKFHKINEPIQYMASIGCVVPKDVSTTPAKFVNLAVNCSSHLADRLINKYEWIITLGNGAAKALTGLKVGITKLRVGPPKYYGGLARVIHTVSPAACMVNESQYPFLCNDIGKLVKKVTPSQEEVKYKVLHTAEEALDYLSTFKKDDVITLDIETDTEKDLAFSNPAQYEMLCVGIKRENELVHVLHGTCLSEKVYQKLACVVNDGKLVGHNAKFDTLGLRPRTGKLNIWFDTMLASYTFDERPGIHSLKYLAQEFLGASKWEEDVQDIAGTTKSFGRVPDEMLHKYNAHDVEYTYQLYVMFADMLERDEIAQIEFKFLIQAANMLADVEHVGFKIDHKLVKKTLLAYTDKMNQMDDDIVKFVVGEVGALDPKFGFNTRSPKQILTAFELMGVKLLSTDKAQLDKVIEYGDDMPETARTLANKLVEYRQLQKLTSTYVQGIDKREYRGRIHANFSLHGTTTGRLACKNPNIQNIPRSSVIKEFFVAGEGKKLVHADYSQAELRTLSWLAGDQYFRDILNDSSRDIFDELVPDIFPGTVKGEMDPKEYKELRTMVKTYVYGLAYGRTATGIAEGFKIEKSLAQKHMNRFFDVIPRIIEWQKGIRRQTAKMQLPHTVFGRRRRFYLRTDRNASSIDNESLAFLPQSTASDFTLLAAINLNNDPEFTGHIVNIVHDDIIAECPEEDAERCLELIKHHMKSAAESMTDHYVAFETDGSIGDRWSEL